MTPQDAIIVAVLLPVVGAVLIALAGSRPNLREGITLTTAVLLFATVLTLLPEVLAGARPEAMA